MLTSFAPDSKEDEFNPLPKTTVCWDKRLIVIKNNVILGFNFIIIPIINNVYLLNLVSCKIYIKISSAKIRPSH